MKKDGMKKQWIAHANDIVAANLSVLSCVLKSISLSDCKLFFSLKGLNQTLERWFLQQIVGGVKRINAGGI